MAWSYDTKNNPSVNDYRLNVGSGFNLLVATGFELLITPAGGAGWLDASKKTATWTNATKN